jgi:hypothetical protein
MKCDRLFRAFGYFSFHPAANYPELLMKSGVIISSDERRTSTVSKRVTTIVDFMVNLYTKAAYDLIPQPLNIPRMAVILVGSLQDKYGLRVFRQLSDRRSLHLQTPVFFMEDCLSDSLLSYFTRSSWFGDNYGQS